MPTAYGHSFVEITASNQNTIQALTSTDDTNLTGWMSLIGRGVIRSKRRVAQNQPLNTDNSAELIISFKVGSGSYTEIMRLLMPNVASFVRYDVLSEFGSNGAGWVMPPNVVIGVSGNGLTSPDRITLHGNWYRDTQELTVLI